MSTTIDSTTRNTGLDIKPNMNPMQKAQTYASYYGLEVVSLIGKKIPSEVINIIPKDLAVNYKIIAYELTDGKPQIIKIAIANPQILKTKAPDVIVKLKEKRGINVELAVTTPKDFEVALANYKNQTSKDLMSSNTDNRLNGGLKTVSLIGRKIPFEVLSKFPYEVAHKYKMVVFDFDEGKQLIKVALSEPQSQKTKDILDFIRKRNNLEIDEYKTSYKDIDYALKFYQQKPILEAPRSYEKEKKQPPANIKNEITKTKVDANSQKLSINSQTNSGNIPQTKSISDIVSTSSLPLKTKVEPKPSRTDSNDGENEQDQDKVIKVNNEELEKLEIEEKQTLAVSEKDERNLDILLPTGIKNEEELAKVVKGGIVPKIVSAIIYFAVYMEASDVHIEPTTEDLRLRFRVDGQLKDILKMPLALHAPIISRIKILAKLKIDEQRIPQDGRFEVISNKKDIDLRISTLPTINGEKVVERILDKSSGVKTLEQLGFSGDNLSRILKATSKSYGIVLSTGPTGSGKTTTLYAVLNKISKPEVNVITLEDPVEYEISGINQCQIKPKIGFSFAEGLRSILRQDPNIIMVGEIRDSETASMSTHAALTGHLVLTTLHTNDAAGALPRLINMGVEPFLITSSINCIVAQRLVRRICPKCKMQVRLPLPLIEAIKEELAKSSNPEVKEYSVKQLNFYKGRGCEHCNGGYKGRIGIFEVLLMSRKIEDLAIHRQPAHLIARQSLGEGMVGLKQDGIIKALKGFTTIEEVIKAVSD